MIIFQAALPTMVIASSSGGPHQLPLTFIPANKNVSSTTRKPRAEETKPINLNFKCGKRMLAILWMPSPTCPLHPLHCARFSSGESPSELRRDLQQVSGKGTNWEELGWACSGFLSPLPQPIYTDLSKPFWYQKKKKRSNKNHLALWILCPCALSACTDVFN